jgi:hypothetical protein
LARYYGTQVADGFFHSFSGWVIYIAAFLLLFAFGWLIDRFNPQRRRGNTKSDGGAARRSGEAAEEAHGGASMDDAVAAPSAE